MDTLILANAVLFLSTLSLRRATRTGLICGGGEIFLSTLSLRRATFNASCSKPIHAFLSTLSLRRATALALCFCGGAFDFYPRSPCGERQPAERHANSQQEFLSTLSLRRATDQGASNQTRRQISIHALLAESDKPAERHANSQQEFLSTLSLRRATAPPYNLMIHHKNFYPRSPCGERQSNRCTTIPDSSYFYPRSPCGERPTGPLIFSVQPHFYPRSPCGERR